MQDNSQDVDAKRRNSTIQLAHLSTYEGGASGGSDSTFVDLEDAIRQRVDERNGVYRSCCTMIDSRVLTFAVQSAVIIIILLFAMYQAATNTSVEARQTYIVIVTTILSVYLPTPKVTKKQAQEKQR